MMAARKVTSTGNPNVAGGTAPVRPAVPAPSTGAPKNRMDVVRQAQQQRKQDARISAVSRPGGTTPTQSAPRPGDKVPGEKVTTNSQLTGQALARKGFGSDTGGGNYPAARQKPRPETDSSIGNPMGDYNPGQEKSTPTSTKSQSQLNTEPDVKTTNKQVTSTGNTETLQAFVPHNSTYMVSTSNTLHMQITSWAELR